MRKESRWRTGCFVVAIGVLGAFAREASFAGEAGSAAHDGVAKDVNASAPGGKDPDAIDTRIAVEPRRAGGRQDEVGEVKAKIKTPAPGNFHRRAPSAPDTSSGVVRNSIGMSIFGHENVRGGDGTRPGFPTTGLSAGATGGPAKLASPAAGIVRSTRSPALTATPYRRGTIGGPGPIRPGSSLSALGGPSKAVAGINGTAIRRKH